MGKGKDGRCTQDVKVSVPRGTRHDDPHAPVTPPASEANELWKLVLSAAQWEATQLKLQAVKDRAARKGLTGDFSWTAKPVTIKNRESLLDEVHFEVTITGTPPKHNGWSVTAAIDRAGEDGEDIIVSRFPGQDIDIDRQHLKPGLCQHCNTVRRRNRVYLVSADNGDRMVVGSSCLKDFIGQDINPVLFTLGEDLGERDVDASMQPMFEPETILRIAIASVKLHGWHPSRDGESTADHIKAYLGGGWQVDVNTTEQMHADGVDETITQIMEMANDPDGDDDYMQNLSAALNTPYLNPRHIPLVASSVAALYRKTAKDRERQRQRESEHVGEVGQKIDTPVRVVKVGRIPNNFAYHGQDKVMLIMETPDGDTVKSFTTAGWAYEVNPGDEFTIAGTVKSHDDGEYGKSTTIIRPKTTP